MTPPSFMAAWLGLVALLAVEVALIALLATLLARCTDSAAWRRTFCQAGLVGTLLITASELSGSAGVLAGWGADAHRAVGRLLSIQPGAGHALEAWPGAHPKGAALPATLPDALVNENGWAFDSMGVLWFGLIWMAGAGLVAGRACLARCLFGRFGLKGRRAIDPALARRVETLTEALGMRRGVRILHSARLRSPIAFDCVRPALGLPLDFSTRFEALAQEAILAHELAHLAAHDPFWWLMADAATALLWWHPAVWWLRRRLRVANELAADEASLVVADGPRVLAQCLVAFGARLAQPPVAGQLGVAGFRSDLGCRVQRLLHLEGCAWSPPQRLPTGLAKSFGPLALAAAVIVGSGWIAPRTLSRATNRSTMKQNWHNSLAALALWAAFHAAGDAAAADAAPHSPPAAPTLAAPEGHPGAPSNPQIAATDSTTTNGPGAKIQFDLAVYDFGEAKEGELVKHTYIFTNTGGQMLEVSAVRPSCGCTTAGEWTRQVEPGRTGTIPIQFNTAGQHSPVSKTITVTSNDKANSTAMLQLKGTIWKPIEINPPFAVLNVTAASPRPSTVVSIISHLEEPLELAAPESKNPAFSAELKTIRPGKEFQVIIAIVPPVAPGNVQGQITLKSSSTNLPPITLTAFANVQPDALIFPNHGPDKRLATDPPTPSPK